MTAAAPTAAPAVAAAPLPVVSPAAESAAVFDQRFQAVRATVNAEALALDTLAPAARLTPAYGVRYDSLRRLTLRADTLRHARDRWRALAAKRK